MVRTWSGSAVVVSGMVGGVEEAVAAVVVVAPGTVVEVGKVDIGVAVLLTPPGWDTTGRVTAGRSTVVWLTRSVESSPTMATPASRPTVTTSTTINTARRRDTLYLVWDRNGVCKPSSALTNASMMPRCRSSIATT